jgi:tRNA(His) 5'-end guanylyltransferase
MKTDMLGARMRRLESFHTLRVPPGAWTILRVDGCGFSRLTAENFSKPFDDRFSQAMRAAAKALVDRFSGLYAYTESDEISLLLPRTFDVFDREVEKLVSLTAATASAAFSLRSELLATFDSRVIVAARSEDVVDYFRWRQSDAARCALNGWCYWTLRNSGTSQAAATAQLQGLSNAAKHELLFAQGINFATLPAWQRNGIGIYWQSYEKSSVNPRTKESVVSIRRRLATDTELPSKDEYARFLRDVLSSAVRV